MSFRDFWRDIVRLPDASGRLVPATPHEEQRRFIDACDEEDETGRRRYPEMFLWWAKKCSKSFSAAARLVHHLVADKFERNERRGVIGAPDQDNGVRVIFRQCRLIVERNPFLTGHVEVSQTGMVFRERVRDPRTGGHYIREHRLDAPANDPHGQTGEEYSFRVCEEMWTAPNYDFLESLILSPTRPNAVSLYLSYHGMRVMQRPGIPLHDLITRVEAGDPNIWASYIGGVEERASWRVVPWISEEWVEQQRREFAAVPAKFRRTILNLPAGADAGLISGEELRASLVHGQVEPTRGLPGVTYTASLDAGLTNDWTAFAIGHLDGDSRAVIDVVRTWRGTPERPVDLQAVEDTVVEFAQRFEIARLVADNWQLVHVVQRLNRRGVQAKTVGVEQSRLDRIISILKRAFSGRLIRINAQHVALIEQLESVQVVESRTHRRDLLKFAPSGKGIDAGSHDDIVVAVGLVLEELSDGGRRLGVVAMPEMAGCALEAYTRKTVGCYLLTDHARIPGDPVCRRECPAHQATLAAYEAHRQRTGEALGLRMFVASGLIQRNRFALGRMLRHKMQALGQI